jgi:hypothetical protein
LKQGRAILVWNGCAYRVAGTGKQGSCVIATKASFVIITSRLGFDAPPETQSGILLR